MEDLFEQGGETGEGGGEDADVDFDLGPYWDPGPAPLCVLVWGGSSGRTRDTHQLKSASCQLLPGETGRPAMTISQRRMVLATTGMRPMERMTARAAREMLVSSMFGYGGFVVDDGGLTALSPVELH